MTERFELDRDEHVLIDEARLREAMQVGGRADVTIRSTKSGQHVRVSLSAKKSNPSGYGYISRAKNEGRVGTDAADVVFANDPTVDFSESGLAKWMRTGKHAGRVFRDGEDKARVWAAETLLWVLLDPSRSFPDEAEVFLATRCCICAKKLEDPKSIERGIGPECYGKATGSKALPHVEPRVRPRPISGSLSAMAAAIEGEPTLDEEYEAVVA